MTEKQILDTMKALDLTRQEAIDLIKEDEEIDKMTVKEAQADLSADQKKAIKSMTKTGEKKHTVYKFDKKRERKVDEVKKHLMDCIRVLLEGLGAKVEPLTTEAEMHFVHLGESYTIKLIKHRTSTVQKKNVPKITEQDILKQELLDTKGLLETAK